MMQAMNLSSMVFGALVGAAALVPSYAGTTTPSFQTFGYQDPETGVFHPLKTVVPDASTTPTTGTVKVTFNVKLVSTLPKGATLLCATTVTAQVVNVTTQTNVFFNESVSEGVALSGTTATCTATIPYSWLIPSASGTKVETFSGTYVLSANASSSVATVETGLISRSSTGVFASSSTIPASGSTSSYTVSATL